MNRVRVLIVDDSAFMRNALTSMLTSDPEIEVIGTARDGVEAVAKTKALKPDIVTMDVEMPRMDGINALRKIMTENPVPVVMVSSLTSSGAKETLEALEIGAVDYIPKNLHELSVNILKIKQILVEKIKAIGRKGLPGGRAAAAVAARKATAAAAAPAPHEAAAAPAQEPPAQVTRATGDRRMGLLVIGTSTGGPKALQSVVPLLPADLPVPIVIAQHMPPNFTGPFAERLNQLSRIRVKEAAEGDVLTPGTAYVAPGGQNMRVKRSGAIETKITLSESREMYIYCPSVDALLLSAAESYPGRVLGVILTGMGNDGLEGARKVKETGGRIFAQDEHSCVVYGMPKAVVDGGLADKVLSIEKVAGEIINSI